MQSAHRQTQMGRAVERCTHLILELAALPHLHRSTAPSSSTTTRLLAPSSPSLLARVRHSRDLAVATATLDGLQNILEALLDLGVELPRRLRRLLCRTRLGGESDP